MFNLTSKKTVLNVQGMTCHHCEMTVEKALLEIEGVKSAKADHSRNVVEVQSKKDLDLGQAKMKIEGVGYKLVSGD